MSKPNVVVIPGAWHAPHYLDAVSGKLEKQGYTIHARKMPAVGATTPPKDLSEDVAAARALVEEAIGSGNDVIAIVHSWGGIVAGTGFVGLGKKEREAEGKKGGLIRVGYLAAFIVPEGVSLMDAIGGSPPPWFDVKEPYVYPTDPAIFYNDLPIAEQQKHFAKIESQTYAVFHDKTKHASWRQIPTSYLLCEDDLAIPSFAQTGMTQAVKDAGAEIEVHRIKAGHSPFLSKVDETVDWIVSVGNV
ncbi:Alpha/beta hydrolase fold-1 [Paraphoma chrysanthemicola]|uniref:Alpha/beta hydrolase fold-1 n=1 Tax=Paraphoma chrysanthemicola TaxID=798071 RepID=A0A8K0W0P4_9PLEO|nr:Alpha/beta hydrolase fold-1 [Paraphoma chrysanthemicola]